MVYLHFPSNLTEEELMLQAKYQKLKKKKKAVQALKAPKPEPEKVIPKRPTEARDAREIARKLLKSGAIQAIKSPPPLPQNATFKRPRAGRERKLSGSGTVQSVASYQPFSSVQEPMIDEKPSQSRVKYLYDSFVTATDKDEKQNAGGGQPERSETQKPRSGNTVLLAAARVNEELIRKAMSVHGTILNITCEHEKNKAFIAFEKPEQAVKVIAALDGTSHDVMGNLRVSFARRQPPNAQPSQAWSPLAGRQTKQSDAKRTVLTYDDIFD